ncbi:hypothetical protein Pla22_27090 [Rubripirellula amarantea]|uniref:Uncharacterized protein n=1 Tax=Rubripirellula amarantea TaxID=2527999 RepID=A0A5C5WYS5_9BACT|nr:hypothetical protein [Rubripirellula amarantea]TWT55055.1 hypothetical protein Pla22_27090 [Rubripirellula amarantea]
MTTNFPDMASPESSSSTVEGSSIRANRIDGWEEFLKRPSPLRVASVRDVFGEPSEGGQIYRWGVAVATGAACDPVTEAITRLSCDGKVRKKDRDVDLLVAVDAAIEQFNDPTTPSLTLAASAVRWAVAVDRLLEIVEEHRAHELLRSLLDLHEAILSRASMECPLHLILGGELGLTLAWRLPDLEATRKLRDMSIEAVAQWCSGEDESVASAIEGAVNSRLVLASLIRCKSLVQKKTLPRPRKTKALEEQDKLSVVGSSSAGPALKRTMRRTGDLLATWVVALTSPGGVSAFSNASSRDVKDDVGGNGLLDRATHFDREALVPALTAALGSHPTGGRLAWEVSLPDSMWCENDAKLAVLMPEWDVRKGRTVIDFQGDSLSLEVFAGKSLALSGVVETNVEVDGEALQSEGDWDEICRFSDDDVHYLELEQPWSGGWVLQRQFLLLRDDRCLLFADTILPDAKNDDSIDLTRAKIQSTVSLPVGPQVVVKANDEIREILLGDVSGKQADRALVIPISASEWKVGPTRAKLHVQASSADSPSRLVFTSSGTGNLYLPVWIDFERRRFNRDRTWRTLTVADALRICRPEEASAYRVQSGSEQWCVYRSLGESRCRTFLGKHMMANFFVSRFDMGDGVHESLITVDDEEV